MSQMKNTGEYEYVCVRYITSTSTNYYLTDAQAIKNATKNKCIPYLPNVLKILWEIIVAFFLKSVSHLY